METSVAIPKGWQLVPVDPTEEMAGYIFSTSSKIARQNYRAMLTAAPTPPAEEVEGYTLTVLRTPSNPTEFKPGDHIKYDEKSGVTSGLMLVIGEDDTHLHTFSITGNYPGNYF